MRTKIVGAILIIGTVLSSLGEEVKQALAVDVPATWNVDYQGDKGIQFYTVKRKDGDSALLMFSRWPVPGNVAQIPKQIKMLAEGFVSQAKNSKDFKLKTTEYKIEKIKGDAFTGSFVKFSVEGGIVQTMFMIGDEEGIWNGQFTGTKERWLEALEILKKLRYKG